MLRVLLQIKGGFMSGDFNIDVAKKEIIVKFEKTLDSLDKDLQTLRTGRASTTMLDGIRVDYFGQLSPLSQVATITTEPRTIIVTLWDRGMIIPVEAAIRAANIGINPVVEGVKIRLPIPPLTEERRKELVKKIAEFSEKAKISLRQIRKHYLDDLKLAQKNKYISEDDLKTESEHFEKDVKNFIDKVDIYSDKKSKEIMTI